MASEKVLVFVSAKLRNECKEGGKKHNAGLYISKHLKSEAGLLTIEHCGVKLVVRRNMHYENDYYSAAYVYQGDDGKPLCNVSSLQNPTMLDYVMAVGKRLTDLGKTKESEELADRVFVKKEPVTGEQFTSILREYVVLV